MGPFIVLDEIIEGWLGFSDPSQERNLYAGKGMDDLVRFDDDHLGSRGKNRHRFDSSERYSEGVIVCVDRREKSGGP